MAFLTHTAARYLAERGYTVKRRRRCADGPPSADTLKHWCERGTLVARKAGHIWLIAQAELDRLLRPHSEKAE